MKQTFKEYLKQARWDFAKVAEKYPVEKNLELRTAIDSLLIAYDQAVHQALSLDAVIPRYIFDEGIKYAKELAEKNDQELNLDTCTMIASDYLKHVAHFLRNNVG